MRVLVTGGAGYIGSHTAKRLAKEGYEPVVLDDLRRGHHWAVRWGPFIEAGLEDHAAVARAFSDYRIQAVVHFAANAYVGESMRTPDTYFRNNLVNSLALFDIMRAHGVSIIIFSSSCATYGDPHEIPIPEAHLQLPVNPYGESKLMVERILHWYCKCYGLSSVTLRYFNAAGADLDGEIGEDHTPETHIIPLAIYAALGRLQAVPIFGTDYATPDGTAIRDYIHVDDLAVAHVSALRYLLAGGETCALNLGSGRGHSVREVISAVVRITGEPVPISEEPRRPGDPPILIANAEQAARVLGWRPEHSALDTIVETAWRWHAQGSISMTGASRARPAPLTG
jgi:UDP-arabinose 4-epimerase